MIAAHSHPSGWLCAAPSPCALNRRLHPPAKSSPDRVGIPYLTGNLKKHLTTMLELIYDSRSYSIHTFCSPTGPRHSPTDEGLSKCGASAPIPALLAIHIATLCVMAYSAHSSLLPKLMPCEKWMAKEGMVYRLPTLPPRLGAAVALSTRGRSVLCRDDGRGWPTNQDVATSACCPSLP